MTKAHYQIITVPHPSLKTKSHAVSAVDDTIRAQMDAMLESMYDARGIGLASNQVNILNRVIVMDVDPEGWVYGPEENGVLPIKSGYRTGNAEEEEEDSEEHDPIVMANPEIIWSSEQRSVYEEGCLSIPQQYAVIERPASVRVRYLDYDGQPAELDAHGLLSHCVQHEIDHLNGVLFIDYLSSLKRNMILKKVDKLKKQELL